MRSLKLEEEEMFYPRRLCCQVDGKYEIMVQAERTYSMKDILNQCERYILKDFNFAYNLKARNFI